MPAPITREMRRISLSQRVVHHWNKLSVNVVSASTVNTFKNRLDASGATTVCAELLAQQQQVQVQVQYKNINNTKLDKSIVYNKSCDNVKVSLGQVLFLRT